MKSSVRIDADYPRQQGQVWSGIRPTNEYAETWTETVCVCAHYASMPMFFFHTKTIDGVIEEDTVGAPFDSKDEAIREAEDYVRGVMQDAVNGSETVEHFIEVTDEQGNTVVKLDCKTTIVREGEKPLNR